MSMAIDLKVLLPGSEAAAETPRPIAWPSFFEPRLLACGARGIVGAPRCWGVGSRKKRRKSIDKP